MNSKQRRAQRHEMRTRERDRPLAFGARVGSSSFSTVGQLIGRASSLCTRSTKRARVGWCDQLLAAVVMVKSDMVLGLIGTMRGRDRGGGRRLMQHEGTVHVPRDAGSRALSFTEACVASP